MVEGWLMGKVGYFELSLVTTDRTNLFPLVLCYNFHTDDGSSKKLVVSNNKFE